ncbi:D-alanyl-D-alanine carboxypeptidase family protein [Flavobacteriaceae bacterium Ap0902]|nr:D-alanyl-D-alanine carboxypeptidase family protein [Flavobacteriaceae bacterium Ap0902]
MYSRREFLKYTALSGASLLLSSPLNAFHNRSAISTEFSIEDLMGKSKLNLYGKGFNLREEAANSLSAMLKEASKSGFNPYVVSSYRSYNHQKRIWNNKYTRFTKDGLSPQATIEKIIKYSTIPGTSRHHWGTDFDIIGSAKNIPSNPLHEKHFNQGGQYHAFKLWLNENSIQFGFKEVYTNNPDRKGFKYEPWHFSYATTACKMLSQYIEKEVIGELYKADIMGAENFTQEFLSRYLKENILDINPELIP